MTDIERDDNGHPVAYCINSCGVPAVGTVTVGVTDLEAFPEATEALCADCLAANDADVDKTWSTS